MSRRCLAEPCVPVRNPAPYTRVGFEARVGEVVKMVSADGASERSRRLRLLPQPLDPCVLRDLARRPRFEVRLPPVQSTCEWNARIISAGPIGRSEVELR